MSIIKHLDNGSLVSPELGGIYSIKNVVSGRIYIGQSISFAQRWDSHTRMLNDGTHYNKLLREDWKSFGSEVFEFSVVEYLDPIPNILNNREHYWAEFYRSLDPRFGYNLAMIQNCHVLVHAPCEKIEIGGIAVLQRVPDEYLFITGIAGFFGKSVGDFLSLKICQEYSYYIDVSGTDKYKGTWVHPDFFSFFAKWVDIKFYIAYNRKFLSEITSAGESIQSMWTKYTKEINPQDL